jgi:hypothetical protein
MNFMKLAAAALVGSVSAVKVEQLINQLKHNNFGFRDDQALTQNHASSRAGIRAHVADD